MGDGGGADRERWRGNRDRHIEQPLHFGASLLGAVLMA